MKFLFLFFLLCLTTVQFAQTGNVDFNSPENIKKFADYLFCDKDYLRAALEYERLKNIYKSDTIDFKIALSYSYIKDYYTAIQKFSGIINSSLYFDKAKLEVMKINFLSNDFTGLRSYYKNSFKSEVDKYQNEGEKLFNFSYLFTDDELPPKDEFILPFDIYEKEIISSFYDRKRDPPYKSGTLAGIMSAIIPGSGKIYVGETGDGIVAFITTTLFAFIAYDNFRAGHITRAWIWTGVAAFFYAGNVYGSVAAAQVHNAKITFEFNDGLNVYLNKNNYYIKNYEFCN
jgi:TM2 domain-containing membrane protein YozV